MAGAGLFAQSSFAFFLVLQESKVLLLLLSLLNSVSFLCLVYEIVDCQLKLFDFGNFLSPLRLVKLWVERDDLLVVPETDVALCVVAPELTLFYVVMPELSSVYNLVHVASHRVLDQ